MSAYIKDNMFVMSGLFYILEEPEMYRIFTTSRVYELKKPLSTYINNGNFLHIIPSSYEGEGIFLYKSIYNTLNLDYFCYIGITLHYINYRKLIKYFNL